MADKSHRPNSRDVAGETPGASRADDSDGIGGSALGQPTNGERAYTPPELIKYGVLADITAAVGTKGKMDGASMAPKKTGF